MITTLILALTIGGAAGAVAALCGVGGGIIMVPLFVQFLGLDQKHAVATSLAAIIATSIAASMQNWKGGLVDWNIALPAGIAGAVVAWFASDALKRFSNQSLQVIFAVLMIGVGVHMLLRALRVA